MKKYLLFGFIALFLFSLFGCMTMDKARQKFDQNQKEAAEYCGVKFPPLNTVEVLAGETTFDTVYIPVDVVTEVPCPPSEKGVVIKWKLRDTGKTILVSKRDTIKITTVNTALVDAERFAKEESQRNEKEWRESAENRANLNFWLVVALIGCGLWITKGLWLPTIAKIFA